MLAGYSFTFTEIPSTRQTPQTWILFRAPHPMSDVKTELLWILFLSSYNAPCTSFLFLCPLGLVPGWPRASFGTKPLLAWLRAFKANQGWDAGWQNFLRAKWLFTNRGRTGLGNSASWGETAIFQQSGSAQSGSAQSLLSALTAEQLSLLGAGLQGTRDTEHHEGQIQERWYISCPLVSM